MVYVGEVPQDDLADFGHEGAGETQPAAVADAPADDPPQDVAPALVARHHAVANEEAGGAGVLGHHPDGEVGVHVLTVLLAGQLAHLGHDGRKQVRLVDVGLTCSTAAARSRPMPVSTLGAGRGVRLRSESW